MFVWKLRNILPGDSWVKEEITIEIRRYFELNSENTKYKNLTNIAI